MISAFGVEHSGISKMSDDELRHRKRVQAGLSTAGAVVGLSALGAKGVKVGTGRYIKPASRAAKYNAKIDTGVNNALVVGAGVGGASGLNTAAISRKEAGKKNIHKADGNRRIGTGVGIAASGATARHHFVRRGTEVYNTLIPGTKSWEHAVAADEAHQPWEKSAQIHHADQHNAYMRDAGKLIPKIRRGRKLGTAAVVGGSLIAASGAHSKSSNGKKSHVTKSAFGVEHEINKSRKYSPSAAQVGAGAGAGAGYAVNRARKKNLKVKAGANARTADIHRNHGRLQSSLNAHDDARIHFTRAGINASNADHLLTRAHSGPRMAALIGGGTVLGAAAGAKAKKKFSKAFDPEARRHTQLGTAAGVAGTTSVVSGASAARSAKKARGHYKMASGANQATKTRLLEGLNLRGAAEAQHAHKTALTHGEMLGHVKAGNAAARKARGKTGVALGAAAAAGGIMHHSNNGAANYVGPYQPKAVYGRAFKATANTAKTSTPVLAAKKTVKVTSNSRPGRAVKRGRNNLREKLS